MFLVALGVIATMVALGYGRNDIGVVTGFALAAMTIVVSHRWPKAD